MSLIKKVRGKMAEMGIINPDSILDEEFPDTCFICDKELKEGRCENCNVDFNEIFICPLIDDSKFNENRVKICNISKMNCNIKGLDYEKCNFYHSINV